MPATIPPVAADRVRVLASPFAGEAGSRPSSVYPAMGSSGSDGRAAVLVDRERGCGLTDCLLPRASLANADWSSYPRDGRARRAD